MSNEMNVRWDDEAPPLVAPPPNSNIKWDDESNATPVSAKKDKSIGGFIGNVGHDAVDIGKGFYNIIRHPLDTASAIGDLAVGGSAAIQKNLGLLDENVSFKGEAAARRLAEPFSKAIDDPSGIPGQLADYAYEKPLSAAMNLSGGLGLAGKVAGVSGAAKLADVLATGSTYTNPISLAAEAASKTASVGKLIRRGAKETIGATTGSGPGAVEEALKGSDAFKKAMRGEITGEEVVENAKSALNQIATKRSNDYRQLLDEVSQNKTPIDLNEIKTAVTDKLKNFVKYSEEQRSTAVGKAAPEAVNVVPHPSGGGFALQGENGQFLKDNTGHVSFYQKESVAKGAADYISKEAAQNAEKAAASAANASKTPPKAYFDWERTNVGDITTSADAKQLKLIYDKVQEWGMKKGDNTAIELDRLRRDLDNFYSPSSRVRAFVASARDTVNDAIKKNVPEYAEMTKGYSEATSLIKDIESGLMMRKQGMTGRVTADQTLRRLTSAMRENFELRRDLVEVLGKEGGADISGQVAGYSMSQAIPRGLVGKLAGGGTGYLAYMNPKFIPILAASSPRVMGEFLSTYGAAARQVKKMTSPITRHIPNMGPILRNPDATNAAFQIQQAAQQ